MVDSELVLRMKGKFEGLLIDVSKFNKTYFQLTPKKVSIGLNHPRS